MSKPSLKNSVTPAPSREEQVQLGEHLTAQFKAAIGGMIEFIAFGAMVLDVQTMLSPVSARGHGGKFGDKDSGLKAWLKEFAPEVSRSTAYRCRDIAEGIKAEFQLGTTVNLYRLLKSSELDAKDIARREKIRDFVAGKSQRQLLLYIGKPDAQIGGKRESTKQLTPEEKHREYVEACKSRAVSTFSEFYSLKDRWKLLPDNQVQVALETAEAFVKEASKWLKTPPPARIVPDAEQILAIEAKLDSVKTEEAS